MAFGVSDLSLNPHRITWPAVLLSTLSCPRQSSSVLSCEKGMIIRISGSLGDNMHRAFALEPIFLNIFVEI